jgi:quinol monooxygenase YgiN
MLHGGPHTRRESLSGSDDMPDPDADHGVTYAATYLEVFATAARAAGLLLRHDGASHSPEGALRCEVLQRIERPGHFLILTAWRDRATLDAQAARAVDVRHTLSTVLVSPPDERLHRGLSVGRSSPVMAPGRIYAVTHVDVIPPQKESGAALLEQFAERHRGHAANLRFDVWQQTARPNHFTVVEVWVDLAALEAHAMSAEARRFRETLAPMSGALYDQRLYRSLDATAASSAGGAESTSTRMEVS